MNHDLQIMPSCSNVFRISSMEEFRKILQILGFFHSVFVFVLDDMCKLESISAIDQVKRLGLSSVQKNGMS